MPCTMKVRVIAAKDLPVMDRKTLLADPFVTLKLGDFKKASTSVARKTLNPVWGELFRFEIVNDLQLQDEPLVLEVMDKDTYTADDAVGSVLLDLNCLAGGGSAGASSSVGVATGPEGITGFFPIYDSFQGTRGYLHLSVKLTFFADVNKQSSAGVMMFGASTLDGYEVDAIHGFVEELILEKDPEFSWVDSFRASRTSNDARSKLFHTLSARVSRNVGRKAMELGGNAVLAFRQSFDLEGDIGIVARASGTAVTIRPIGAGSGGAKTSSGAGSSALGSTAMSAVLDRPLVPASTSGLSSGVQLAGRDVAPLSVPQGSADELEECEDVLPEEGHDDEKTAEAQVVDPALVSSALEHAQQAMSHHGQRMKSGAAENAGRAGTSSRHDYRREVHLLTLTAFPPTVQICLGGIVCARSVKLLDASRSGVSQRSHDQWWLSLRKEIKSHARALNCTTVIGYSETTTYHDGLVVLTAYGTAARVGWYRPSTATPARAPPAHSTATSSRTHGSRRAPTYRSHAASAEASVAGGGSAAGAAASSSRSRARSSAGRDDYAAPSHQPHFSALKHHRRKQPPCSVTHVPYPRDSPAFRMALTPCATCGRKFVPEMLLTSIELYAINNDAAMQTGGAGASGAASHPPNAPRDASDAFPVRDLFRIPIVGKGALVEARVCRALRRTNTDEQMAQAVSESLPFLEYELHRQLVYKLRVLGCNAAFGLKLQLVVGDNLLVGVSTATACFLPSLPPPPLLLIRRYNRIEDEEDRTLVALQQKLMALSMTNRAYWSAMLRQWKREQKAKAKRIRASQKSMMHALSHKPGSTPPMHVQSLQGVGGATHAHAIPHSPMSRARRSPALQAHPYSSHSYGSSAPAHGHASRPRLPTSASHGPQSRASLSSHAEPALLRVPSSEERTDDSSMRDPASQLPSSMGAGTMERLHSSSSTLEAFEPAASPPLPAHAESEDSTAATGSASAATPSGTPGAATPSLGHFSPRPHSRPVLTLSNVSEEGSAMQPASDAHESGEQAAPAGQLPEPPAELSHPPASHLLSPPSHAAVLYGAPSLGSASVSVSASPSPPVSDDSESSSSSEGSEEEEDEENMRRLAADVRSEFILQVDDEADEDLMAVLLEPTAPDHVELCNVECMPGMQPHIIGGGTEVAAAGRGLEAGRHGYSVPSSPVGAPSLGFSPLPAAVPAGTPSAPPLRTSLPNVQLLTLVRRVEWKDDVTGGGTDDHNVSRSAARDKAQRERKDQQKAVAAKQKKLVGAHVPALTMPTDSDGRTWGQAPPTGDATDDAQMGSTHKATASLTGLNRLLSSIFHDLYAALCFRVQALAVPCYISCIRSRVSLPAESTVEVWLEGLVVRQTVPTAALQSHAGLALPGWAGVAHAHRNAHESERERARAYRRKSADRHRGGKAGLAQQSSSSSSSSSSSAESSDGGGGIGGAEREQQGQARTVAGSDSPRRTKRGVTGKHWASRALSHRHHPNDMEAIHAHNGGAIGHGGTHSERFTLFSTSHTLAPHPPLPPSLLSAIDPATHKALGMPLLLPALTFPALRAFRSKVIRQLVNINELAGREASSYSGLRNALMQQQQTLQAQKAQASVADADAAALQSFMLEQAAATEAQANTAAPLSLLPASKHRTLPAGREGLAAGAMGALAPTPNSADVTPMGMSILEALPLTYTPHPPQPQAQADAASDAAAAAQAEREGKEKRLDEEKVGTYDSGLFHGTHPSHLTIHLPQPSGSGAPSPSPLSRALPSSAPDAAAVGDLSQRRVSDTAAASFSALMAEAQAAASLLPGAVPSALSLSPSPSPSNELLCVEFTPASFVPHAPVWRYLGRVTVHVIKETYSFRDSGGLGLFVEQCLMEAQQIARAHVISRGGNALLAYTVQEFRLQRRDSAAYAILSIAGDAAHVIKQTQA